MRNQSFRKGEEVFINVGTPIQDKATVIEQSPKGMFTTVIKEGREPYTVLTERCKKIEYKK